MLILASRQLNIVSSATKQYYEPSTSATRAAPYIDRLVIVVARLRLPVIAQNSYFTTFGERTADEATRRR